MTQLERNLKELETEVLDNMLPEVFRNKPSVLVVYRNTILRLQRQHVIDRTNQQINLNRDNETLRLTYETFKLLATDVSQKSYEHFFSGCTKTKEHFLQFLYEENKLLESQIEDLNYVSDKIFTVTRAENALNGY